VYCALSPDVLDKLADPVDTADGGLDVSTSRPLAVLDGCGAVVEGVADVEGASVVVETTVVDIAVAVPLESGEVADSETPV